MNKARFVELSHLLHNGMPVYPGFPEPEFGALLDHQSSRSRYEGRAEFFLGQVTMPGNLGTYIDSPFHRHRDRCDLSQIPLEALAGLPGLVIDAKIEGREVVIDATPSELRDKAVLVRTGWDGRWGTDDYWTPGPFLGGRSVDALVEAPAALVGVDFWNVDDTDDPARPAHTRLLDAGVLIVEHMCNLGELPLAGFRFFAPVLPIVGGASFPVRAFAELEDGA
ncbi:MAG: cyclase family protein [Actinomycetota bacterium]|nr:cyclase family protein [Actinomycetota bacterium]